MLNKIWPAGYGISKLTVDTPPHSQMTNEQQLQHQTLTCENHFSRVVLSDQGHNRGRRVMSAVQFAFLLGSHALFQLDASRGRHHQVLAWMWMEKKQNTNGVWVKWRCGIISAVRNRQCCAYSETKKHTKLLYYLPAGRVTKGVPFWRSTVLPVPAISVKVPEERVRVGGKRRKIKRKKYVHAVLYTQIYQWLNTTQNREKNIKLESCVKKKHNTAHILTVSLVDLEDGHTYVHVLRSSVTTHVFLVHLRYRDWMSVLLYEWYFEVWSDEHN